MRRWLLAALLLPFGAHAAGTLRFGLDADLDTLDPARSGSYIERAVNTSRCDQLLNIDAAAGRPGAAHRVVPAALAGWGGAGGRRRTI